VRYTIHTEPGDNFVSGFAEYVFNLGGGSANNAQAYTASRPGADENWHAYRAGVDATYGAFAGWILRARLRYQYANEPLIPGEQLGIAGLVGVRGFREREITGDKGYFLNLEAQAPPVVFDIAPFIFYDDGKRWHVVDVPGASPRESISSAGAGFVWEWRGVDLSATFAHVLNGASGGTPRDHNKVLFSAFYRF
jgi:hemolysin activation/secretion protein